MNQEQQPNQSIQTEPSSSGSTNGFSQQDQPTVLSKKKYFLLLLAILPPIGFLYGIWLIIKKPKQWLWLAAGLIVISLLVGAAYFYSYRHYFRNNTSNNALTTAENVIYSKYHTYILLGLKPGSGGAMKFDWPIQLIQHSPSNNNATFNQVAKVADVQVRLSAIYASSYPWPATSTLDQANSYLKQFNQTMQNGPTDKSYAGYIKNITQYIQKAWPGATADVATAQPLSTANIKSNAWQFDFTVKTTKKPIYNYSGKIIYIPTQKNYYYFLMSAIDKTWQKNSSAWQHISASIKVDQLK